MCESCAFAEKYRRLKKTNATFNRKLGGLAGGVDALKAMGFAENGDDLVRRHSIPIYVPANIMCSMFVVRCSEFATITRALACDCRSERQIRWLSCKNERWHKRCCWACYSSCSASSKHVLGAHHGSSDLPAILARTATITSPTAAAIRK